MMEEQLLELNQKIDTLTEQVTFLAEEARIQRVRRQEFDELKNDLTPVMMEMYQLSVRELDEIDGYVELEDMLRLMKRLMRNTRNLERMLDQMESLMEMGQDISPLTQQAFLALMQRLDEMERKGYFTFMREGMAIMDRVVEEYSEEDVRQLGDNIVLILNTVKEMTQPEIMTMLQDTAVAIRDDEYADKDVSMFSILRQLNDPEVKRGLAKTLNVLKTVAD
ncbi:MAG TPA: DUF1641 domain-containing protein [Chromatiaceae bacterium]|nr:DUF1641 domain-containing protein [Chromatiaceae bacterium]